MTDTAAILVRHVRHPAVAYCAFCHQVWTEDGCDAHQLGVALEAMTADRNRIWQAWSDVQQDKALIALATEAE